MRSSPFLGVFCCLAFFATTASEAQLGVEVAVPEHLEDGEEFDLTPMELFLHGALLFDANWTNQEGGGRPLTKGTGGALADPFDPLVFPRDFNRVSAPDANSCFGCHNVPRSGGGGDIVANVFVLGQRFDFATFDEFDIIPTKGAVNELGDRVLLQDIANSRNTLGMFGGGYIEMLAREITVDLQAIRDGIDPGGSAALESKGISYGTLSRDGAGNWDTSLVEGLPQPSLNTSGPANPPSLVIRPFHQASAVVSLREFSNNAFNHHHGIQSTERFGLNTDPDGDGFINEMTRADITAVSVYQALLPPPGRVIPNDAVIEQAVLDGEESFQLSGCTTCHRPSLPLSNTGRRYVEPNPFNPPGNLQTGEVPDLTIDLNDTSLPLPRLRADGSGVTHVRAFTDLKLHDITDGPTDPNREPLNMHFPAGSVEFFEGNSRFITRKLWGVANEPPFFHHGQYTTMRRAIEAHHGEAEPANIAWQGLSEYRKNAVIEFLKTLQVLPAGTQWLVVDENFNRKRWPPQ